ncbi:hypothetical protein EDD21DRAFT_358412 [Dissophora ornata]|nr:hypothetical protein EDD21DRAFT_358412 [Dissophora ornata]
MSPNRLWPTLQRRKLEKLKDVRMREFERACDDSLEWLENYYQGCVYAALQNKPRTETKQIDHSPFRTIPYRSKTPSLPPLPTLRLSSKIATVEAPAPLTTKALSFDVADTSDTSNAYKTPTRGLNIHDKTFTKSGKEAWSRSKKSDEDEDAMDSHLTPGSRARDSMTLVSPRNTFGSMKERDVYLPSTPALTQGLSGSSDSSEGKRGSQDMDVDHDVQIYDAEYKRLRSSPFQDSVAPVRFDSPERDSARLDARSSRLGVSGRNSGPQGGGRASSSSVSTDATLADDVARRRERSGTSSSVKSQDQRLTGRPSEVQEGSRKRPISVTSSRHSRPELSEKRDTDSRQSVLEIDIHEGQPSSKLSGANPRTPLDAVKFQAPVLSLISVLDDSDHKTDNQVIPQRRDRAERTAPEPTAAHAPEAGHLRQQPRASQIADVSSTSKVESAGEPQGSTTGSGAKSAVAISCDEGYREQFGTRRKHAERAGAQAILECKAVVLAQETDAASAAGQYSNREIDRAVWDREGWNSVAEEGFETGNETPAPTTASAAVA